MLVFVALLLLSPAPSPSSIHVIHTSNIMSFSPALFFFGFPIVSGLLAGLGLHHWVVSGGGGSSATVSSAPETNPDPQPRSSAPTNIAGIVSRVSHSPFYDLNHPITLMTAEQTAAAGTFIIRDYEVHTGKFVVPFTSMWHFVEIVSLSATLSPVATSTDKRFTITAAWMPGPKPDISKVTSRSALTRLPARTTFTAGGSYGRFDPVTLTCPLDSDIQPVIVNTLLPKGQPVFVIAIDAPGRVAKDEIAVSVEINLRVRYSGQKYGLLSLD